MEQGSLIGQALNEIEEEWILNNFKISNERVKVLFIIQIKYIQHPVFQNFFLQMECLL